MEKLKTPTTAAQAEQIRQVHEWLLRGASHSQIVAACKSHWPAIDPEPMLLTATAAFVETAYAPHAAIFGWCLDAARELYRRMSDIGDYAGALQAVGRLQSLLKDSKTILADLDAEARAAPRPAEIPIDDLTAIVPCQNQPRPKKRDRKNQKASKRSR